MIIFDGTEAAGNVQFMIFKNEKGSKVRIPLSNDMVKYLLVKFEKIQPRQTKPVEAADSP